MGITIGEYFSLDSKDAVNRQQKTSSEKEQERKRERESERGGERERESEKDGLLTASGKKSTGGVSFPSFIAHRPTVPY
jgi:hypothetical protein